MDVEKLSLKLNWSFSGETGFSITTETSLKDKVRNR